MIAAFAKVALRCSAPWLQGLYRLALWACVVGFTIRALRSVWKFTIDDSGISYAYAKHLAQGFGPVAAPGAPWVEGYSNALWVFTMIPFQWAGAPLPEVSKWLGVASFIAMVTAGVALLVRQYGPRLGTAALSALWVFCCGVCLEVVVWVVAGLENALLGALLLGLAALDQRERARPHVFPWSALCAFGLCITRPEAVIYAAPVVALRLWDTWRDPQSRRLALPLVLAFVVPLTLYHLVHFAVFHEWVPNTYYAKPQGRSLGKGLDYLRRHLEESGLLYIVPLALIGMVQRWRQKFALSWYCVAGVSFILYAGGDWMPHGRFLSFFAAPLLLLGVHGVHDLLSWSSTVLRPARRLSRSVLMEGGAALAFLLAVFFWRGHHEPRLVKVARSNYCHFCQRTKDAKKLDSTSITGQLGRVTMLTHDFGGPSWTSDVAFYPLDFLGLCDASVARIRRDQDHLWVNTLLSPYLFHEQPHAPSWIYLPKNFWRSLGELPEFELGYYGLGSRLLPYAPGGSYVALHKGHLVDFFPPLDPASKPAPLTPTLGLVGAGWFSSDASATQFSSGGKLHVVVSLLPLGTISSREHVWVELQSGQQKLESERIALARGLKGLDRQLAQGEPLRFDFNLVLPTSGEWSTVKTAALRLVVGKGARGPTIKSIDLTQLRQGSELRELTRSAPRVPSGLPVAEEPELVALQPRILTAVERQHFGKIWSPWPEDRALAAQLRLIGDRLLATQPRQAYLAYVWATQLDARQWETLTKPLLTLRQPIDDADYAVEFALLQDYYRQVFEGARETSARDSLAAPSPAPVSTVGAERPNAVNPLEDEPQGALAGASESPLPGLNPAERLVAFYRQLGMSHSAEYIERSARARIRRERLAQDEAAPWRELSLDSPSGEAQTPSEAWTGDGAVFFVETPEVAMRHRTRGIEGESLLTSRRNGTRGKGNYVSPEVLLSGPKISFSFGGGNRADVGVELLVDGKVVRSTGNSSESVLGLVWWDVSEFVGRRARFRVYDKSSRRVALVDRVLLWN